MYDIKEGKELTKNIGNGEELELTLDVIENYTIGVFCDNLEINHEDCLIDSSLTKIRICNRFLRQLSLGKHIIRVECTGGYALINIYIVDSNETDADVIYEFLDALEYEWKADSKFGLTIRANGPYEKFERIEIGGVDVDENFYSVSEGSTIVMIAREYLETLSEGNYPLKMVWQNGCAQTVIAIVKSSDDVGDNNESFLDPADDEDAMDGDSGENETQIEIGNEEGMATDEEDFADAELGDDAPINKYFLFLFVSFLALSVIGTIELNVIRKSK